MPSTPRILVVEDDVAISEVVLMLLKHYGHEAKLATTLVEAKALAKQPQDVIVLDLVLPDGCGIDILESLRMAGSTTRVIVLTGSTDAALERKVRRLTPGAVFHKPLNFFELLEGIRREVEQAKCAA